MLILSRKIGESVVLPDHDVKIRILRLQGNRVRLGVEAPQQTEIHREEVWERLEPCRKRNGTRRQRQS